jgi:hypothetical protein
MSKNIVWGIVPDRDEQPRVIFGEDTTTGKAFLSINGQEIGDLNLQNGKGIKAL